jgi:hypothetical protein
MLCSVQSFFAVVAVVFEVIGVGVIAIGFLMRSWRIGG